MTAGTLRTPAIGPLLEVVKVLEGAGVVCALGGSGLLASLDLVNSVNDWDLTCDREVQAVHPLLTRRLPVLHGNSGCHADHKLALAADRVEVICRFAFNVPGGVVKIPTHVTGRWRGVPLGSPEGWAVAYTLLGLYDDPAGSARRRERAESLFEWLGANGADGARLDELLWQPLPAPVAAKLRALPRR